MDPGSVAGMTGGWVVVGASARRIGSPAPPPARPFDSAQGERPHAALGWISAYAEMTEKGGWERGGWGFGSAGGVEAFGGVAQ